VSILTLLFLLTGTVYPIPGWWTRYGSHSLGVLKIAGDICHDGHLPSAVNGSMVTQPLAPVSHVVPRRVFARTRTNGYITTAPAMMRRPSTSGPASLVDKTVRANWSVVVAHSLMCSYPASNIISFPCLSRSASQTHHVMRDVRSPLGSRWRDPSNLRERSPGFIYGLCNRQCQN
jgi:hypothetical protein